MSPVRLLATMVPALAIACAIATNAALAFDTYVVDMKARSSKIIPKWQTIIPPPFNANPWIMSLDGLSPPVDNPVIAYKKFYLGWLCWPQDCVGSRVVFLVAQDGSEAYGMLRSKALKADEALFGNPSPESRERRR